MPCSWGELQERHLHIPVLRRWLLLFMCLFPQEGQWGPSSSVSLSPMMVPIYLLIHVPCSRGGSEERVAMITPHPFWLQGPGLLSGFTYVLVLFQVPFSLLMWWVMVPNIFKWTTKFGQRNKSKPEAGVMFGMCLFGFCWRFPFLSVQADCGSSQLIHTLTRSLHRSAQLSAFSWFSLLPI